MSIDKIIIENFKIFEGQHVFDLKDLNIFTGPNNSGKSTLIKAISLFSKGLERGDFPNIDLIDNKAGDFRNLVNNKTTSDSFKIGFFIELGKNNKPFKVLYEFKDGNTGYQTAGSAQFANFEILNLKDEFIFGAYTADGFVVTTDNIEYEPDEETKTIGGDYPFLSPMDGNNPAELFLKVNLSFLEELIGEFTDFDFTHLIRHFQLLAGKHNNWWAECFNEWDYSTQGLNELTLTDLIKDLFDENFCNLGDYEIKKTLLFGGEDIEKVREDYQVLIEKTNYGEFLNDVLYPIFGAIDTRLNVFRRKNFAHIAFQNFDDQLVINDPTKKYLTTLYPIRNDSIGFNVFTRDALKIFDIDGYILLKSHLNTAIEVDLVTELDITDLRNKEKAALDPKNIHSFGNMTWVTDSENDSKNYQERYKSNPTQNIADMGKGTANLIGLILKTYSVLHEYKKEIASDKNRNKTIKEEKDLKKPKLILIEEPEAFLHPNWQSKLADFFLFCFDFRKKYDVRFLVETHSVYLIQKLQYLVAKQKIESENLNILYFNPDTEKEKFFKMEIRKDGIFKNKFGPGFYDETARLTIDILNSQNPN